MNTWLVIFLILVAIANLGAGFGIGLLWERLRWNNLIRCGVLPKPRLPVG